MDYMILKQLADQWGITPKYLQALCREGKIEGAYKNGHLWMIPVNTPRPVDHRVTTGAYKDWRKRYNVSKWKVDGKLKLLLEGNVSVANQAV